MHKKQHIINLEITLSQVIVNQLIVTTGAMESQSKTRKRMVLWFPVVCGTTPSCHLQRQFQSSLSLIQKSNVKTESCQKTRKLMVSERVRGRNQGHVQKQVQTQARPRVECCFLMADNLWRETDRPAFKRRWTRETGYTDYWLIEVNRVRGERGMEVDLLLHRPESKAGDRDSKNCKTDSMRVASGSRIL